MIEFYINTLIESLPIESKHLVPSISEFTMYYKMATQGMIYRCLLLNLLLSNLSENEKRNHLNLLVNRTLDAIEDNNLHTLLAVGKK